MSSKRDAAIGAGLAAALTLLLAFRAAPRRVAEPASRAATPVRIDEVVAAPTPASLPARQPTGLEVRYDPNSGPRLIRDAYVDVDQPCAGQPFTATAVVADASGGANVDVSIDGTPGAQAVVTLPRAGEGHVFIRARDHQGNTDYRTLTVQVAQCKARNVAVEVRSLSGMDRFALTAKGPFSSHDATARYVWDLGDGTTEVTREPYLEHSYANRPQEAPSSSFIVKLVASAHGVAPMHGLAAVVVTNAAYQNRVNAGVITPAAVAGNSVRNGTTFEFPIRFHNYEKTDLELSQVRVERHSCDESIVQTDVVSARSVLAASTLPPGDVELQGALGGSLANEGFCRALLTFTGNSGGTPVQALAAIALDAPPSTGTPITASASDPAQRAIFAKYTKAAAVLHRTHITDEDVAALEAKGAL